MGSVRSFVLLLVAVAAAFAVAASQPAVDATRRARNIDNALLFVPDGEQVRAASTGFEEVAADVLWIRAVLVFGERFDTASGREWTTWLRRMVRAVNTLDPRWRTAYFYGGALLRVAGDVEGSTLVFRDGAEAIPEDAVFPFSVGMNAYLYDNDPETAAPWLERAAAVPSAPAWYAAAAAAMHQKAGARSAAMDYLRETIRTSPSEAVREDAKRQLGRLVHNELVDGWKDACLEYRAGHGHRLDSPEALGALLGHPVPPNPRGDAWVVGSDGVVRSEGAEKDRVTKLRGSEVHLVAP